MKGNICKDRCKMHRDWPLEAAKFLWNTKGSLCLWSQILCNIQYVFRNYLLRAMMYFGNKEINKIKFLLHGHCSWHFILLGQFGVNHTVSVTASSGTHDGGLHITTPSKHHCLFAKAFCFFRWTGFFCVNESLVLLISYLHPCSCSGSWEMCWMSTRGLRLMPNYRQWRQRIWKTRRGLPGWLSGFGKTYNLWPLVACFLRFIIVFAHSFVFHI